MRCVEPPASVLPFAITEPGFGSVSALLCPGESCRATARGLSEQTWREAPQTHLSCGCRLAVAELNCPQSLKHGLCCWSSLVWPAEISPIPLHTFSALPAAYPLQWGSGRTSASEQPPPAFSSVSTGPVPGRRQQLGHLQDTKGDSALSRGGAGPQRCCRLQSVAKEA